VFARRLYIEQEFDRTFIILKTAQSLMLYSLIKNLNGRENN